jgi:RimJ/RimL family protein N-acetyltransferase
VQLRREFQKWRKFARKIAPVAKRVLVTLGGADPANVTADLLRAIAQIRDIEVTVVIGGANPRAESIRSLTLGFPAIIQVETDPEDMPKLMAWADVAIAAAGTTAWELAYMGLPNILMILADNQIEVAKALQREGVSTVLGDRSTSGFPHAVAALQELLTDAEIRRHMSEQGQRLVDGAGAGRLAAELKAALVSLRPAAQADCRLIWEWANDPIARAVSFSSSSIPWEDHERWFQRKLRDPKSFFYIASNAEGRPVGQIRFDVAASAATVSVSIAADQRGKGFGPALILRGSRQLFADSAVSEIHAYIKRENETSIRAFQSAPYSIVNECEMGGHAAVHLLLKRNVCDAKDADGIPDRPYTGKAEDTE